MRGHVDKIGVNGEMRQAATKGKKGFVRIAVKAVLLNGVLHVLACERIFQFGREDGQPIEEQRKIKAFIVTLAIMQLAHFAEDVTDIQLEMIVVQPTGRAKV